MKRREFVQLAVVNTAWLAASSLRAGAFSGWTSLTPVTVHAELGQFFPPLKLVRRLHQSVDSSAPLLLVNQYQAKSGVAGHSPEIVDIAVRLPDISRQESHGNLSREVRELVVAKAKDILEKELGYRAAQTTVAAGPAFWYPYSGKASGNAVFCRLTITRGSTDQSI